MASVSVLSRCSKPSLNIGTSIGHDSGPKNINMSIASKFLVPSVSVPDWANFISKHKWRQSLQKLYFLSKLRGWRIFPGKEREEQNLYVTGYNKGFKNCAHEFKNGFPGTRVWPPPQRLCCCSPARPDGHVTATKLRWPVWNPQSLFARFVSCGNRLFSSQPKTARSK